MFKRLEMRPETRRAMSDVCAVLTANYGIMPSFEECQRIASAIDQQVLAFGRRAIPMVPDEWNREQAIQVVASEV